MNADIRYKIVPRVCERTHSSWCKININTIRVKNSPLFGVVIMSAVKPCNLILRCYAEKIENQWVACCLDFSLAAQADTQEEAIEKLKNMISDYVYDALAGEDQMYASQLFSRKAPLSEWARYYWIYLRHCCDKFGNNLATIFNQTIPMVPHEA